MKKSYYARIIEDPDGGPGHVVGHRCFPEALVEIEDDGKLLNKIAAGLMMYHAGRLVERPRLWISEQPFEGPVAGRPYIIHHQIHHSAGAPALPSPEKVQMEIRFQDSEPRIIPFLLGRYFTFPIPGRYELRITGPWPWDSDKIIIQVAEAPPAAAAAGETDLGPVDEALAAGDLVETPKLDQALGEDPAESSGASDE